MRLEFESCVLTKSELREEKVVISDNSSAPRLSDEMHAVGLRVVEAFCAPLSSHVLVIRAQLMRETDDAPMIEIFNGGHKRAEMLSALSPTPCTVSHSRRSASPMRQAAVQSINMRFSPSVAPISSLSSVTSKRRHQRWTPCGSGGHFLRFPCCG